MFKKILQYHPLSKNTRRSCKYQLLIVRTVESRLWWVGHAARI